MYFSTQVKQFAKNHPFAFWFFFVTTTLSLANVFLETVKIDCRFLYMISDITENGLHVTATVNGSPYPDYLSPFFILSWLTSLGGTFLNRFTLGLPTVLCGALSVAFTCSTGERMKSGLGHLAALLMVTSSMILNMFAGFGLDVFICLCGIVMINLYICNKANPHPLRMHLLFAFFLLISLAVRGLMGPILLGAGFSALLLADKDWKGVITYGITGAFCLLLGGIALWFALHKEGGDELWNLCIEWQFGNRLTYKNTNILFYLLHSYRLFLPASIPFVYTLVFGGKKLFKDPVFKLILYIFFIEIVLTIPNCQHLRYMTLALPPMMLVGAWGFFNISFQNESIQKNLKKIWLILVRGVSILILPSFIVCAAVCIILKMQLSYTAICFGFLLTALLIVTFKPWKNTLTDQVIFLFISIMFVTCFQIFPIIEAAEKTVSSVHAAERIRDGYPAYFFFVDADHDGIKYLAAINREDTKDIVFINKRETFRPNSSDSMRKSPIYDFLCKRLNIHQLTGEEYINYHWNTYNYKTEDEVLSNFNGGIFIVRDKTKEREKFMASMVHNNIYIAPAGTLKLGHKSYIIYK